MQPLSLDALARAKGHSPAFLAGLGLRNTPRGVVIAYHDRDDSPPLEKLRTGLDASTSRWPAGQPLMPYGRCRWMHSLEKGYVILVEGESDCWALWRHGFPALGLPGAGTAHCLDADDIAGLDKIYLHHEPDRGGRTFIEGVAKRLAQLGYLGKVYVFTLPDKDPADFHVHCEKLQAGLKFPPPLQLVDDDWQKDFTFPATVRCYLDNAQELDLMPFFVGQAVPASPHRGPITKASSQQHPTLERHAQHALQDPLAEMVPGVWSDNLIATPRAERAWVWHGLLAPKAVTLLTAVWKSGKTTLLSALLGQMKTGGSLAGRAIAQGKALVISEEADDIWYDRVARFGFAGNVLLFCRPFPGKPFPEQWEPFLMHLADIIRSQKIKLVVIDPLASFLPVNDENDNAKLMRFLASFQRLTREGASVLILHHPRKGQAQEGQMARGGGALCGFVDVIVEMTRIQGGPDDRRRVLNVYSRFAESPKSVCVKLNETGTGFEDLGDAKAAEQGDRWRVVRSVLEGATRPLTAKEILERWPEGEEVVSEATLSSVLRRAVEDGEVVRQGKGGKVDPFRYHLPGQPSSFDPLDPMNLMADWARPDYHLQALKM